MSTQRTIDETGKDVTRRKGCAVVEVLYLRPDPEMDRVAEWVPLGEMVPDVWFWTGCLRRRIILDNES